MRGFRRGMRGSKRRMVRVVRVAMPPLPSSNNLPKLFLGICFLFVELKTCSLELANRFA